jgi:hypothetical protein
MDSGSYGPLVNTRDQRSDWRPREYQYGKHRDAQKSDQHSVLDYALTPFQVTDVPHPSST